MFIYFHQHKKWSNKGQLAPVFLVVIVVLIIMTMITVNLGKIAIIKTDAANSVDAGALAGGSGMANLFNSIAVNNSYMKVSYQEFFADTSVMVTLALTTLAIAQGLAISAGISAGAGDVAAGLALDSASEAKASALVDPCEAATFTGEAVTSIGTAATAMGTAAGLIGSAMMSLGSAIMTMHAMNISIISFAVAQQFSYMNMRKMAQEGHKNSIKMAHQFVFRNSGIGAKLRRAQQDLPEDLAQGLQDVHLCNYQEVYNFFVRNFVKDNSTYIYAWADRQDRPHSVTSMVNIDKVDKFSLKTTALPLAAEVGLIAGGLGFAYAAEAALGIAGGSYTGAAGAYAAAGVAYGLAQASFDIACPLIWPLYYPPAIAGKGLLWGGSLLVTGGLAASGIGIASNATGVMLIIPIYPLLGSVLAGLIDASSFVSSSNGDSAMFIICYIDDVIHNHKVHVDTLQTHAGKDLDGFWESKYPPTASFSVADFSGFGKINPPKPNFDASIIRTDISLQSYNACPRVTDIVQGLENEITTLQASTLDLQNSAVESGLLGSGLSTEAQDGEANITSVNTATLDAIQQGTESGNSIIDLTNHSGTLLEQLLINEILAPIAEPLIAALTDSLSSLNQDTRAGVGFSQESLFPTLTTHGPDISNAENKLNSIVNYAYQPRYDAIQQEIQDYKNKYPECF